MIRAKYAAAAIVIVAALVLTASAQQSGSPALVPDGKVVVLNTSIFPTQIGELKQKYDQVDGRFKDRYQKLQQLDAQVKSLENQIQTQQQTLTAEKLQQLKTQYDDLKRQGQRELEDFQADYQKALEGETRPVREKLSNFLGNYATQRQIIMIVNLPAAYQAGTLAYVNPGADITDDFVKEYNKANPVPTGSSTPAAPPAKPGQR